MFEYLYILKHKQECVWCNKINTISLGKRSKNETGLRSRTEFTKVVWSHKIYMSEMCSKNYIQKSNKKLRKDY